MSDESSSDDEGNLTEQQQRLLNGDDEDSDDDEEDYDATDYPPSSGRVAEAYANTPKSQMLRTMDWGIVILSGGILVCTLCFVFGRIAHMMNKAYFQ
jgi:hypothetical protein